MLVKTHEITERSRFTESQNLQVYCGLDSCVTHEVRSVLDAHQPQAGLIYDFERALQGPYLDIMLHGFKVDELARREAASGLTARIEDLQSKLDEYSMALWDRPLNPRSHPQLKEFFYDVMRLPQVVVSHKGVKHVSVNREALEKLDDYLYARPFTQCIMRIRDLAKQREIFTTEIDSDLRWRASYNIAGTETGRPSSSANAFGTARGNQNIAANLRYVFIADPGYKMCVIDLEQVEARDVGFFEGCLFDDWTYLDACESTDLHTYVTKLVWPGLGWTDDAAANKQLAATTQFYRDFSYRDMAKRGAHLSNYFGTAWTMARTLKIPQKTAEDFQDRYCKGPRAAFPAHPRFWQWCAQQLQTTGELTTPFGRRRHFFGRKDDDATLREAIAFMPQGTTADRTNLGMWRVWKRMPHIQLLAQTYDSITFQYPESMDEQQIVGEALELMRVELRAPNGRSYVVPGEAKIGWNWGACVTQQDVDAALGRGVRPPRLNPGGLAKFKPGQPDARWRAWGTISEPYGSHQ